ncbi:MAG TPA: zinc ribbon domain-containing protein [Anaerolineae bacterium]|nr:zinc ribbon domain-containing protein [Anaerolineae bacterium]
MDIIQIVLAFLAFTGAFIAALWLALIVWTFRDMRSRSRDIFAQILAALVVAVLNLPGLIIYMMLRPKETLAEAYERSLEEEALLQGIEEVERCPGCGGRVRADFLVCPACNTRLKKACRSCGRAINLRWNVCPYCGTPQISSAAHAPAAPALESAEHTQRISRRKEEGGEAPIEAA